MVGRISPTIDVDSKVPHIRANSEARLAEELRYASHLGMPAVMVQLHGVNHTNLARIVSNHITKGASFQVWVQVPVSPPDTAKYEEGGEEDETESPDTWDWWNRFRLVANSNSKVNLCLGIVENIPTETQIMRWVGEPLKTVSTDTAT